VSDKVGILRFLGTNCDRDVWSAVEAVGGVPEWLWFENKFDWREYQALVLPGGFSYGDYLRCGALAAKSPVMASLAEAAGHGVPVLGICNGFQILCESGLLPGALVRNEKRKFIDQWVDLKLQNSGRWNLEGANRCVRLPIAHGEGRYFADADELSRLFDNGQVWWTYEGGSPNGSLRDIAGVMNKSKNVCGLMPHPERAMFDWMGGDQGRTILGALMGMA